MTPADRPDVCIVGLGYVGLPTAVFFAKHGLRVVGVDTNPGRIADVNGGVLPFVEPGLEALLREVVSSGMLEASARLRSAQSFVIAVPTPVRGDRSVDLSFVLDAADKISECLRGDELVILESTVPPQTTEKLRQRIEKNRPDLAEAFRSEAGLSFAHCPERVLPGAVMKELSTTDRLIGGLDNRATERAARLYSQFCSGELLRTDAKTAELAKLTENSFRDVNIAFANELSQVCETVGVDVWELISLANRHPRVNILQPGPGVGGHCIAVDPWFVIEADPENTKLIRTARNVNDAKPQHVVNKILERCEGLTRPRIVALGVTFKANVDDMRQSPSLEIVRGLARMRQDTEITVVDPLVRNLPEELIELTNVALISDYRNVKHANVLAVLVDHDEFRSADLNKLSADFVVDTRGLFRDRNVSGK